VLRGFVVPRGITVLAGGIAAADATEWTMSATLGGTNYTIGENQYLAKHASTVSYEARIIRRLERETPTRLIGVLRNSPATGWRLVPIDKKTRTEYALDKADLAGAKHNELVAAEPKPGRIAGFARVKVAERIGSMDSPKTISLIAIHDHGIPVEFPKTVIDEAKAAKPVDPRGRTDLRHVPLVTIDPPDARDHDDAVWAGPDDDAGNSGGHVVLVAIADVAHYVTPGSALDKEAMSAILLRYKGAEAGEIDWRPTETLPEDFYAY